MWVSGVVRFVAPHLTRVDHPDGVLFLARLSAPVPAGGHVCVRHYLAVVVRVVQCQDERSHSGLYARPARRREPAEAVCWRYLRIFDGSLD